VRQIVHEKRAFSSAVCALAATAELTVSTWRGENRASGIGSATGLVSGQLVEGRREGTGMTSFFETHYA
jgi:hypothetical protein